MFAEQLQRHTAQQIVYVDENNAGEMTFYRSHAWSPIGLPAAVLSTLKRQLRVSMLPALGCQGYASSGYSTYVSARYDSSIA